MANIVKVALCLPWYNGSDRDTCANNLNFLLYLGRLQERSWWLANTPGEPPEGVMPPLDWVNDGHIPREMRGTIFQFGIADETGCSLVGMARERTVDNALAWGADYILFWDDDMLFATDAFLRLYGADKPVCAALAFTARAPISPVIFRFDTWDVSPAGPDTFKTAHVFDYRRDALQQVDAVGSGMVLIRADVFRQLPKPWFATGSAMGEDIYFCYRCKKLGIDVWVDTRVKTLHKRTFPGWHDELEYLKLYEAATHDSNPQLAEPAAAL